MATHFTTNGKRRGKAAQTPLQFDIAPVPGQKPARGDRLLEADVQRAVLAILEQHPRVAFSYRMNTGSGFLIDSKTIGGIVSGAIQHWKLKALCRFIRFAFPGCADILGMLKGGRFIACECKSTTGDATDDQLAFLSLVNKFGGCAFIARKADDVLRYIPLEGDIP